MRGKLRRQKVRKSAKNILIEIKIFFLRNFFVGKKKSLKFVDIQCWQIFLFLSTKKVTLGWNSCMARDFFWFWPKIKKSKLTKEATILNFIKNSELGFLGQFWLFVDKKVARLRAKTFGAKAFSRGRSCALKSARSYRWSKTIIQSDLRPWSKKVINDQEGSLIKGPDHRWSKSIEFIIDARVCQWVSLFRTFDASKVRKSDTHCHTRAATKILPTKIVAVSTIFCQQKFSWQKLSPFDNFCRQKFCQQKFVAHSTFFVNKKCRVDRHFKVDKIYRQKKCRLTRHFCLQ